MKRISLIALLSIITCWSFAQSTVWKSDPNHSRLGFSVLHMSIADVSGYFGNFEVQVTSSKPDFSDAVVEMSANVKSINTGIEKRDEHLRTPDFFDAATYPKMTFKSTSITKSGDNKYTLTGTLSLHGISKTITVDMLYRGVTENPMSKAPVAGLQFTTVIKRTDFNIAAKFGAPMLSNEVVVKGDGEFGKQ